jgi:hypothetical protein
LVASEVDRITGGAPASRLFKSLKRAIEKISRVRMAILLKTSRPLVDRIVDPRQAAALVGQLMVIELVRQSWRATTPRA